HIDLAGLEMEIAAAAVDVLGVRPAGRSVAPITDPAEAGRDVRLVRRLVLGEAGVAIDPERRSRRVCPERQVPSVELLVESEAEGGKRLFQQSLVLGLAGLEPAPVVVLGEIDQELDRLGLEAGERGACD